jgi:hypothetical protein
MDEGVRNRRRLRVNELQEEQAEKGRRKGQKKCRGKNKDASGGEG